MTRPSVKHDGFLVPNAALVDHPRMAEPDQIDFNTVAQARWGVVEGCLVTVSGSQAQCMLGGLALVNGELVTVAPGQSANLGTGGSQDRFDLITVDGAGTLKVAPGTPAVDPTFPDTLATETVLAAVFIPTGVSNLSSNVIDKRKFIVRSLLTKIGEGEPLIRNVNGTGDHFLATGAGKMVWGNDTVLQKSGAFRLRVTRHLEAEGDVTAGGHIQARSVTATEHTTGSNLLVGSSLPASAEDGALFQHSDGRLYIRKLGVWKELATIENATPVGTIITSIMPPSAMPAGWIPLDGVAQFSVTQYPALFEVEGLLGYVTGTGTNRMMKLPNAQSRVLMTSWSKSVPLEAGGRVNNLVALGLVNIPNHKHFTKVVPSQAVLASTYLSVGLGGGHGHTVDESGAHGHAVNTQPHYHNGLDNYGNPVVHIGEWPGGRYKLDALFNDRNHPVTVDKIWHTAPATQAISVSSTNSEHRHTVQPAADHKHPLSGYIPSHGHEVTEDAVGGSVPFDITPAYLTVFTYIRV